MSARRIAREIAVIILPQLPRDRRKLEQIEFDQLIAKSVQMLVDYGRQCLSEADGFLQKSQELLIETETEHPDNKRKIEDIRPVAVTSAQLKEHIEMLRMAAHLVSEALDLPEMTMASGHTAEVVECRKCEAKVKVLSRKPKSEEVRGFVQRLVETYLLHAEQVDDFISQIKTKWRVERMVSIDRDILRLACTEAFFMQDIPVKVAINEAVELCHRFADERAAKFINGILSDLVSEAETFRQENPGSEAAEPVAARKEKVWQMKKNPDGGARRSPD